LKLGLYSTLSNVETKLHHLFISMNPYDNYTNSGPHVVHGYQWVLMSLLKFIFACAILRIQGAWLMVEFMA
jgi:hypothetical protein